VRILNERKSRSRKLQKFFSERDFLVGFFFSVAEGAADVFHTKNFKLNKKKKVTEIISKEGNEEN
jgi:hypothetical protein